MKGFKSSIGNTMQYKDGVITRDGNGIKIKKDVSHFVSKLLRYDIDKENDVYVLNGYGAFKTNIDDKVEKIADLKKFKDAKTKNNPYQDILDLIEEGYDLIVGPAFPNADGSISKTKVGIYCKNYLEMVEKLKQEDILKNL